MKEKANEQSEVIYTRGVSKDMDVNLLEEIEESYKGG